MPWSKPPFDDYAPVDDCIKAYDERYFVTYLRQLNTAEYGAEWGEVASVILGTDANVDSYRGSAVHNSHLERALSGRKRPSPVPRENAYQ